MKKLALPLLTIAIASSFSAQTFAASAASTNPVAAVATDLTVENGVIYEPLKGSPATAGYGTLTNQSSQRIEISGISVSGFKASEIHTTVEENGLMKMKKLERVVIEPKGKFELKPGGNHIMLFDSSRTFKTGEVVPVVFTTKTSKLTVAFKIQKRADTAP